MFRTVLVHVEKGSEARTRFAVDLARQFDATLIGLTAGIPRLPVEVYDTSLGTVAFGDYTEFEQKHLEAEFGESAKAFTAVTEKSGVETSWRAVFEAPSVAIARAGVAADIIVTGAGDRSLLGDLASAAAGDIVLRTGRPVLVAPEGMDRLKVDNVLVAWSDRPESQRAIADAIPFMKRAGSVVVAHVQEGDTQTTDLSDATAFLLRHGIAAKPEVITQQGAAVEDQLLSFAQRTHADLIVAGAYGHSRFREWVLGGVTRTLLTRSTVPCLFSH